MGRPDRFPLAHVSDDNLKSMALKKSFLDQLNITRKMFDIVELKQHKHDKKRKKKAKKNDKATRFKNARRQESRNNRRNQTPWSI